ncbi:MAG: class I SAM-dependent methyltransferase [Tepidisphaeraceae bacterium]
MSFSANHIVFACLLAEGLVIATLVLVPRLLRLCFGVKSAGPTAWQERVELRYQNQGTYVWIFALSKLRLDPMFRELPEFLRDLPSPRMAMDLGCGHGFAGCSLLEWFPGLKLFGIEPSASRVRAAARAFGQRGRVFQAAAPDFESPMLPDRMDAAFALDMIHFLSDPALDLTLKRIRARLDDGAYLFLRAPMHPEGRGSFLWNLDKITRALSGASAYFRSDDQIRCAIEKAGFQIMRVQMSGDNQELFWFIAAASSPKSVIERDGAEQKHDDNVNHDEREQVPVAEFIPPL